MRLKTRDLSATTLWIACDRPIESRLGGGLAVAVQLVESPDFDVVVCSRGESLVVANKLVAAAVVSSVGWDGCETEPVEFAAL